MRKLGFAFRALVLALGAALTAAPVREPPPAEAAFCPASIAPGIELSADKLLQGRAFA